MTIKALAMDVLSSEAAVKTRYTACTSVPAKAAIARAMRCRNVRNQGLTVYGCSAPSGSTRTTGAQVVLPEHLLLELGQHLGTRPRTSTNDFRCTNATYLIKRQPSGALIQGHHGVNHNNRSELETEAEDALLLSII